jgi:hypothetical protein
LLSGAAFTEFAYRLPTSNAKEKTTLSFNSVVPNTHAGLIGGAEHA